jgi:hypothetical protein
MNRINHRRGLRRRKTKQEQLTANLRSILSDRLALGRYGTQFGGKRDYYGIFGYPQELTIDDYLSKFDRDPLGGRIVEFPADETWRDKPAVMDGRDKDAKDDTPFAVAWDNFAESRKVYSYCNRIDTLTGIGRFGVLFIGVAGGAPLTEPVERVPSLDQILYFRPYGEQSVEVKEFENDPASARFGLPRIYRITLSDLANSQQPAASSQIDVHWTRCIHVAEGLLENEVYGVPRLQRVYNLLDDVLKVIGGASEATWKLMRKGFVLDIDPEAGDLSAEAKASLEEQFDEYDHGLRRYIRTRGMTVNDLGSEVVDPTGPFEAIISLISAATGIPKRILLGSEQGELASSQDASNWAGHIASRQANFAEPNILRPLIDRLIGWGALPQPTQGKYSIWWEPLFEMNDNEKADLALKWANAIQATNLAYGQPVITAEEYRGDLTPFAAEMPPTEIAPPEPAPAPSLDQLPGQGVLEQVRAVVGNAGYRNQEAAALVAWAARLIAREG